MASNELIIDDNFCKSMGTYFTTQGQQLDQLVSEYITILQQVKDKGFVSGEVSTAMGSYITYARKLKKQIGNISANASKQVSNYLKKVDTADQYLF